jgi:acetyl-CoA C-acetyltransferase
MQALVYAAQQIQTGSMEMVMAVGAEVMSSCVYALKDARWGKRLQHGQMTDTLWEGLSDPLGGFMMGITAENLAEEFSISREEQDVIALRSNNNAARATKEGLFRDEIVPVVLKERKKEIIIDRDDHFRDDLTMEGLAALSTAFKPGGTVTAGNASGINDGAAAALICGEDAVKRYNLKPVARLVSHAVAAVEPERMGYGPVPSSKKALERAGLSLADVGLVELNEAFAAQYLACEKGLELNRDITNVNGSGVGLGHPVGATGLRIIVSLTYEMQRRQVKYGMATLCVGGGMGKTTIFERV